MIKDRNKDLAIKCINLLGLISIGVICLLYSVYWSNFAERHIQLPFLNFPIFVGEMLLAFCFLLLMFKWGLQRPRFHRGYDLLLLYVLWVLLKTASGYFVYGPFALRTAALFYYPLFAFLVFQFWRREYWGVPAALLFFGMLVAAKFLGGWKEYFIFPCFVLCLIFLRRMVHPWGRFGCLLLMFWFFSFRSFFDGSRSFLLGNSMAFSYLFFMLVFGLWQIPRKYKWMMFGGLIVVWAFGMAHFAQSNQMKSLTTPKKLWQNIKLQDEKIQKLKPTYRPGEILVHLYNDNYVQNRTALAYFRQELSHGQSVQKSDKYKQRIIAEMNLKSQLPSGAPEPDPLPPAARPVLPEQKLKEEKHVLPQPISPADVPAALVMAKEKNVPAIEGKPLKFQALSVVSVSAVNAVHNEPPEVKPAVPVAPPPATMAAVAAPVTRESRNIPEKRQRHKDRMAAANKFLSDFQLRLVSQFQEVIVKHGEVVIGRTFGQVDEKNKTPEAVQNVERNQLSQKIRKLDAGFQEYFDQQLKQLQKDIAQVLSSDDKMVQAIMEQARVSGEMLTSKLEDNGAGVINKFLELHARTADAKEGLSVEYSNMLFRLFIWRDMLVELKEQRPWGGMSFGRPQRSVSMEILQQAAGEWGRDGWITPHNALLHIIYRAGLVGVLLVLLILGMIVYLSWFFVRVVSVDGVLLLSSLIYWLVVASFLVVWELPYQAIPYWSLWGLTLAYFRDYRSQNKSQRTASS